MVLVEYSSFHVDEFLVYTLDVNSDSPLGVAQNFPSLSIMGDRWAYPTFVMGLSQLFQVNSCILLFSKGRNVMHPSDAEDMC